MKKKDMPTTAAGWTENLKRLRKPTDRAQCLLRCARRMGLKIGAVAEIGVFEGALSLQLRQNWPTAQIYLVDPWKHIPDLTKLVGSMHRRGGTPERNQVLWDKRYAAVQRAFVNDSKTKILRMTSREAAAVVPDNSLDMVHIDGDHRYEPVCEDIRLWLPKVKAGGLVTGHDYKFSRSQWKGNRALLYQVYSAVNDTLGQQNIIPCRQMTWLYVKP